MSIVCLSFSFLGYDIIFNTNMSQQTAPVVFSLLTFNAIPFAEKLHIIILITSQWKFLDRMHDTSFSKYDELKYCQGVLLLLCRTRLYYSKCLNFSKCFWRQIYGFLSFLYLDCRNGDDSSAVYCLLRSCPCFQVILQPTSSDCFSLTFLIICLRTFVQKSFLVNLSADDQQEKRRRVCVCGGGLY